MICLLAKASRSVPKPPLANDGVKARGCVTSHTYS